MNEEKYILRYISRFEKDLNEIADYFTINLKNPMSALNLIAKIEKAIQNRLNCPLSFEPFISNRTRKNIYYRIYVDNFVVYYVVIDNVMEVRRLLYKGRDVFKIIK